MFYVHKDTIYSNQSIGSWGIPIYKDLKRRGIPTKIIDGHDIDVVKSLNPKSDDVFFGRFAHDAKDLQLSKVTLPIIWEKFSKVFPSQSSYHYYNNKRRQYAFMKNNDIPCLETFYVESKKDINIDFPIVMKKSWGAGSEQVQYFESIDDVVDNEKTRGWTGESIYPALIQQYQDIDFDYRVMLFDSGFTFYRRHNDWKTGNKDNFPYGTEWRDRKDVLEKRKSPALQIRMSDGFDDLDDDLVSLIKKLSDIQRKKLDTYYMSWDIINTKDGYKVLEFSVISSMIFPYKKFYDFNKDEVVSVMMNQRLHKLFEFQGISRIVEEYI